MAKSKNLLGQVAVFCLLLAAFFFYFFLKNSPQYSLLKLSETYKNKDVAGAQQYIDVDAVSKQVGDEVVAEIQKEIDKPVSGQSFWGAWIRNFSTNIVKSALPSIGETVEDQTRAAILDDILGTNPSKYIPDFANLKPGDFLNDQKVDIRRDGDYRILIIENKSGKKAELKMRKVQNRWVIFRWENFDEFARDFVAVDSD